MHDGQAVTYSVERLLINDLYDHLGVFQFMWSVRMISDQWSHLEEVQYLMRRAVTPTHTNEQCEKAQGIADEAIGDIDTTFSLLGAQLISADQIVYQEERL